MNRYDKDMMHERELIYDAKGQLHKADKKYRKGDKKKKQEMIHDRELIYDAKTDIHKEDVAKHRSSADKVHQHRRSALAKKGKVHFDSTTDKGIKGLGSSNKSGGKYI